jgi:hypothetical protein
MGTPMPSTRFEPNIPNFDLVDPAAPNGGGFPGHAVNIMAASGFWDVAANWTLSTDPADHHVPTADEIVHILDGVTCTLRTVETAQLFSIGNYGTFRVDPNVNTQLIVQHFMNYGFCEMGSAAVRIDAAATCVIEFPEVALDEARDPIHHGNAFHNFGTWHTYGSLRVPIGDLSADINATATSFSLVLNPQSDLGWRIGDKLYIPDTRRVTLQDLASGVRTNWEYKTITGFTGAHQVNVDTAFEGTHTNMRFSDNPGVIVKSTQVQNLTQNIIFRSANPNSAQTRGQTICHDNALWQVNNVAFVGMGRTINNVESLGSPGPDGNRQGRYSFHVHHCLCPGLGDFADATLKNCVFWANNTLRETWGNVYDQGQDHDPRRWGIAMHDTSFWLVENCVFHGFSGAGMQFAEEGNETRSTVRNCVSSKIGGLGVRDEGGTNQFGQAGKGFSGNGFHGLSCQVYFENISGYDLPAGGFSSTLYLNNQGIGTLYDNDIPGYTAGSLWVPRGPGDSPTEPAEAEVWNIKKLKVAGCNGIFACGPQQYLSQKWSIGVINLNPGVNLAEQENVYNNLYAYNISQISGEYEQYWVTIDGLYAVNSGNQYWYDYTQARVKLINVKLEDSSLDTPASILPYAPNQPSLTFENVEIGPNSFIRFVAYNDVGNGVKMFPLPSGAPASVDMLLKNVTIAPGVENAIQCQGSHRDVFINHAVPGVDDPINDGVSNVGSSSNGIVLEPGMRIFIENHRGVPGANGRLYHNMQAAGALSPYTLFNPLQLSEPRVPMNTDPDPSNIVAFAQYLPWDSGTAVTVETAGNGLAAGTVYWLYHISAGSGVFSFHTNYGDSFNGDNPVVLTGQVTSVISRVNWPIRTFLGNTTEINSLTTPPTLTNSTNEFVLANYGFAPFGGLMDPLAVPHADFLGGSVVLLGAGENTPPTISDIPNQETNVGMAIGPIAFTVGDLETPVADLIVTAVSSNQALVPDGNIELGGSGANRTITLTPMPGQSGFTTITVTVSDGSLSTPDTFVLTVTDVAGNPTITDIADQVIAMDGTTGALAFTVGDAVTPPGDLVVTRASSNTTLMPLANCVLATVSGGDRTITCTPAAGQTGMTTITVTVTDEDELQAMDTFTVTVNAPSGGIPKAVLAHYFRMRRR